jgi:ubiquinone/menaquinone biosynthesis C-methylase UbiE
MPKTIDPHSAPGTTGRVLHSAAAYDFTVWLMSFGRERAFRDKILDLAQIASGETVLDVGCGTGTLAILAKSKSTSAALYGIDASPEMIARARSKARRARVEVSFETALAESLPFADEAFDLVVCTVMLHHLPRKTRMQCLAEVRRVLKPEGRALLVDFEQDRRSGNGLFGLFRHRHGFVTGEDLIASAQASGLTIVRSGQVGYGSTHFVLGSRAPLEA